MRDVPALDKPLYTLAEVAVITRRSPGLVRRWVHRRQLAVIWLEDGTPCVPAAALRARLLRPPRIERVRRDAAREARHRTRDDGSAGG
ncbi:MAG TPA: hypothetical protein VFK54_09395 [Candidatus Limnocylindrales bacterium]|nr:hypothetical protein [Candidatus Limnocylindrales bacterium]